jgi:hypothetical protein
VDESEEVLIMGKIMKSKSNKTNDSHPLNQFITNDQFKKKTGKGKRRKQKRVCSLRTSIIFYIYSHSATNSSARRGVEKEKEVSGGKEGYLYLKRFFWLIRPICPKGDTVEA